MEEEKEKAVSPAKMAEPNFRDESIRTVNQSQLDGSADRMKEIDGKPSINGSRDRNRAKSCIGCLYYSSRLRADNRNPLCIGVTRSLPNVPQHLVGESEMETSKDGRSFTDFRYSCVGYSLYADRKGQKSCNELDSSTGLPVCVGHRVLVVTATAPNPAHIKQKEDAGSQLPYRRSPKPADSTADEFYTRFIRNANLVANRVVKNGQRVGNQMKRALDYLIYPSRRPPK